MQKIDIQKYNCEISSKNGNGVCENTNGGKYVTLGFAESIIKDVVSSSASKMSSDFERRQRETLMCRSSQDMETINPQDRPNNRKQFCLISVLVQFNLIVEYSGKSIFFFFSKMTSLKAILGNFHTILNNSKFLSRVLTKVKFSEKKKVKFSFRKITVGEEGRLALKEDTLQKGALLGQAFQ